MISNPKGQEAPPTVETDVEINTGETDVEAKTGETVFSGRGPEDTVTTPDEPNQEAEISRLTWAVLDGKATSAQRIRLAKLVSAQHDQRRA